MRQTGLRSGTLVQWTKGFTARGVVGEDVVRLLEEALARRGVQGVRVEALVNDTVGTLVAHGYAAAHCAAGVILGTGTNACYPEPTRGGTIVNVEWGGFDGFAGNRYDREVDAASPNPGAQLFEKAVSGMYLGEIARRVLARAAEQGLWAGPVGPPGSLGTEELARWVAAPALARTVAEVVANRSARLAATAVAAVLLWQGNSPSRERVVAVDGSLFEKFPGYRETLAAFLGELLGADAPGVRLEHARDGSGVGAAVVAAVAASGAVEASGAVGASGASGENGA